MFLIGCCCKLGKKIEMSDVDQLSYKKLKKFIATKHPVDPDTLEKFSIWEPITIKDYGLKLFDIAGCIRLYELYKKGKKHCFKWLVKKKKKKFEKPISMRDVPDSDSGSSDTKNTYKGLSNAAIFVGEGPILYLNIMKTLYIMFIVLSILNIPLFMIFASFGDNSFMYELFTLNFNKLTLGTLGLKENHCTTTHVSLDEAREYYPNLKTPLYNTKEIGTHSKAKMNLACGKKYGYINQLTNFGFLYKLDLTK